MKNLVFILVLLFTSAFGFAQNKYAEYIIKDATEAALALVQKDVDKIIGYMPENIIEMGGGVHFAKMQTEEQIKMMTDQNMKIKDVIMGVPGDLMEAGDEWHCILPQTIKLDFNGKEYDQEAQILAISKDKGSNWRFLDLAQYDESSLKLFFPDFNPALLVPASETNTSEK